MSLLARATDDELRQIAQGIIARERGQAAQPQPAVYNNPYAYTDAPDASQSSSIFDALQSGWASNSLRNAQVLRMESEVAAAQGDMKTAAEKGLQANALESRYLGRTPENYVRPDGIRGVAHDIVGSLPYTGESMALQLGLRGVGGLVGGALGSMLLPGIGTAGGAAIGQQLLGGLGALYSGHREAKQNQAEAYRELVNQGATPEAAADRTFYRTYLPSVAATSLMDYITGGIASSGRKLVGNALTKEAVEQMAEDSLVRRAMETLPGRAVIRATEKVVAPPFLGRVAGSALTEALEEGTQTAAQQWGSNQPLDMSDILYSGAIGGASGGLLGGATALLPRARTAQQPQAAQSEPSQTSTQQQEVPATQQAQTTTQEPQATQTQPPQTEATTDVQTLLNGVNSDLERVEGILAENTDQRTVDAFTRYRARLSRAQTALNSAAEMKTGKKKAENIESAKRDIESANEIIYAFRDMLAPSSQTQQPQTAQSPQVQSTTTPATTASEPQPRPQTGNDARVQVLNDLIAKREDELDDRLKKSRGKHTPAVKQLNSLIKELRRELESYQTEQTPEIQTTASQPQQTATQEQGVSASTVEQTPPAPEAPATPETSTNAGELLLDPSPRVIEDAQVEADKANREIEAINARLQGLSPDDRRVGTLEDKRSNAEARKQRAENLMRPQRVSRLRPEAIVTDFNVPVGRLNAARKANSDYLNTTLVRPLRDLRDLLVRTKMGKYEKNAVNVVDKVIRGIELHGNAGMSSQDAFDFFSSVSGRIGANTPNGRMIAHSANNIVKLLAYPDVQAALRNLNEINQRIASSTKTGVTYHRDNNSAAFQAQERMLSQERINDIIEREGQPEQAALETVSITPEETAAAAPQSAPIQPPAPIPADRRQEGTISDPQEAELRAGAREARRQEQVSAARQTVADDVARRDKAIMERANSVQLPEGTVNLNLKRMQENPRVMADFATKLDAAIAAMQDERNIAPDLRDNANGQLRMLRAIRSAWENGTPEQVAKALKDSGLIIGNYASYDEYADVGQTRAAEGQRSNRKTTHSNPFGSRVETQLNDDGSVNPKAEVRGTTQASDEGGAVYGKIGGIDMTERETFTPLPLVSGALEKAEQAQRTQSRQKNDYNKVRKVESALPRYEDNDLYDPTKRKEIIDLMKKQSAKAKRESKKTDKAGIKPSLLEYARRIDEIRKQLESGDRDTISVASVGIDNSKFNFGFDTQGRIDRGKIGLTVDDIIAGKKASVDTGNPSELFDLNRNSVQRLFGTKSRVTENNDGSFTVRVPSGVRIQITANGDIMMSPEAVEMTWGKEMADRVRRGDAAVVGSFDISNGIPLIELSKGIATNFTANHELFHAAAALAITPDQMRTLRQRFGGRGLTDAQIEERIADGYAQWREGRLQPTSTIRAIFRRIADFFNGVRSMFTGENFEDVFRNIESGRIWEQGGSQSGSFRRPLLISKAGAAALDASEGRDNHWQMLENAREMERRGYDADEIWRWTGWEKDPHSDKWITEIYDSPDMLDKLYEMEHGSVRKLPEVFDNPTLFRAFPELKDVTVVTRGDMASNVGGFYSEPSNVIVVNTNEIEPGKTMRLAIVHEVQHAIQALEGMSKGYSPEEGLELARKVFGDSLSQEELKKWAISAYHYNKGEVDARVAMRRLYVDQDGRAFARPSSYANIDGEYVWPTPRRKGFFDGYSPDTTDGTNGRGASYYRGEQASPANGEGSMGARIRREEEAGTGEGGPYESSQEDGGRANMEQAASSGASDNGTMARSSSVRGKMASGGRTDDSSDAPGLDGGAGSRLSEPQSYNMGMGTFRRPSIVRTSEEARREGERVVSEGKKNVSTISKYLEPNGGNGIGQRVLDAVIPLVFNANRMVGRILGWDVFDRLERGLATSPGKAVYKIEHGDAGAGIKGFGEILGDIPAELRDSFETIAAYFNLRDIAGDRRLLMEQRERYKALANDEKRNAEIILRDLRKNRAIYSGEEIRQYEDAAAGSRKLADEYLKQAAEIQKTLDHKQTAKTADWYDAEIKKALAEHPEWEGKIQDLIKWGPSFRSL